MRAFLVLTILASLALAGCTSGADEAPETSGDNMTNETVEPTPEPTPEGCSGVQPPVGPCIEPPAGTA